MLSQDRSARIIQIVLACAFIALAVQLFRLQIVQHDKYQLQSDKNRTRRLRLEPPRGVIYDRNGIPLVENRPSYTLSALPIEVRGNEKSIAFLAGLLEEEPAAVKRKLDQADNPFVLLKLRHNIDYAMLVKLEENKLEYPGVTYETETRRIYPAGIKSPHLFGYIGEVSRSELERRQDEEILPGDLVGKKGFEAYYDRELRGQVGYDAIEVDAVGREVKDITGAGDRPFIRGRDFYLALDSRLQFLADSLLGDKIGGAVMVDVRDGGVLVLCSKPDFDPELFSGTLSAADWQRLLNDPGKPLYDRVIQSAYPPGSTFKMVAATAALEAHKATPETTFPCTGGVTYGDRTFLCHGGKGHGTLAMVDAIKVSCNSYFYRLSMRLSVDEWAAAAKGYGFGARTGIDLPAEEVGTLPDRAYLDRVFGKKGWSSGMMLNLGIGQGDLLVTPVQMAQYTMMIATKGRYYPLHLVYKIYDPRTQRFYKQRLASKSVEGVSQQTYAILQEGMYRVVNSPGGTGHSTYLPDVVVAGKTGTAQNPHGDPHAWYVGFAPLAEPEVAICVLVENGGAGGVAAGPVAGALLRRYFDLKKAASAANAAPLRP
ncbi:MAG TPA: penicillin-binding protein 2 [bacterium]|nr:penicillin-binding protein 2 [bacterium]HQI47260.1 penicillin-binding protein 2 [bacterium]HQJ64231.1 penicillin-binding protein 2 [bacterium]